MRLTCPACGATYDVPNDAIPPAGREVECSECGAVWQARWPGATGREGFAVERALARAVRAEPVEATSAPPADEDYLPEDAPAAPEGLARTGPDTARSGVHGPETPEREDYLPESSETDDAEEEDEEDEAPRPPPSTSVRRKLDDSILRILREEAQREARARAAERTPMETQPDLGLPESPRPRPAAVAATASAPATADAATPPMAGPAPPAMAETASPRSLAPKPRIEEPVAESPAAPSRFGTGFLLAIALAAAALYAYAAALGIATEFPALGPGLEAYVAAVDALRLWLAETVADLRAPND